MLTKLCKCGAMIPITDKLCDKCKATYNSNYDKYYRSNYDIYHNTRWIKLREYILSLYQGVDVYAYYKHNKLIPARTVHHIIEVSADVSKAYVSSNLIPVSDQSHSEIHQRYRQENISDVQAELRDFQRKFRARG